MGTNRGTDRRVLLQALWIFVTANWIYCDVFSLMEPEFLRTMIAEGGSGNIVMSQGLLLGAAAMMEIPILMIFLSRVLGYRAARIASMAVASIMSIVQAGSLFVGGENALHYWFFSAVEIAATLSIAVLAWRWREPAEPALAPRVAEG